MFIFREGKVIPIVNDEMNLLSINSGGEEQLVDTYDGIYRYQTEKLLSLISASMFSNYDTFGSEDYFKKIGL